MTNMNTSNGEHIVADHTSDFYVGIERLRQEYEFLSQQTAWLNDNYRPPSQTADALPRFDWVLVSSDGSHFIELQKFFDWVAKRDQGNLRPSDDRSTT